MRSYRVDLIFFQFSLGMALLAGCNGPKELQIDPAHAHADARTLLLQAIGDADPVVRMHAMEALVSVEPKAAGGVILQAMKDDRLPVMAAAALAAGDICFAGAKNQLLEMAGSKDPQAPPKLMCTLIYALHRLGDDTYTGELGALLQHEDKYVRAEAARMMGKMGEPSGVGPLKSRQADELDMAVRLNIAEALALLGDERSLNLLEAFTKDQYMESRLIAIEGLGRLPHPRSMYVLRQLLNDRGQDPLVRVAAAKSLARLGDTTGYAKAMAALEYPRKVLQRMRGSKAEIREVEVGSLQMMAAMALGQMKNKLAVDALHPLLGSDRGSVRIAAAQAIMQLLQRYRDALTAPPGETRTAEQQPASEQPTTAPKLLPPKLHTSGGKD